MQSEIRSLVRAVQFVLATCLLGACASTGGQQAAATAPPPTPPPPPPPAPAPAEPCPMPIVGDCVVSSDAVMLGGRSADGRLVVQARVALGSDDPGIAESRRQADYTFAKGVDIERGRLHVQPSNLLEANVRVQPGAELALWGILTGRVDNAGRVTLVSSAKLQGSLTNSATVEAYGGRIDGDLRNRGDLLVAGTLWVPDANVRVGGAYVQDATGRLRMSLAPAGHEADFTGMLLVGGRAELAGALLLSGYSDGWGPYPDPAARTHHLLHADGGVFGTFDPTVSPGAFVVGALRYGPNDVWFDLERVSASSAMAANARATALTRASAENLDRVLAVADGFPASPSASQQRFLATAGRLLWMRDGAQAAHAVDSLAGLPQAQLAQAAFDSTSGAFVAQHLDRRAAEPAVAWEAWAPSGTIAGSDARLSPRLVAGVYSARTAGLVDAAPGSAANGRDHAISAYMRWTGAAGWYAGAEAGYAGRDATLDRTIDFGDAGRWTAHSRRRFDVTTVSGEVGRGLRWGGTRLTPFVRVDAATVAAGRAMEEGATGFELVLAPATQQRVLASGGLRFAGDLRRAGWALRVDASAGVSQPLYETGMPLRAAFTGVPDVWFELPTSDVRTRGWLQLGLSGRVGERWQWDVYGQRRSDALDAWALRIARGF